MECSSIDALLDVLRSGKIPGEHLNIRVNDVTIPIKVSAVAGASSPLVISFHGSQDRTQTPIPSFEGAFAASRLRKQANVISVADPTLTLSPSLRTAWYAGAEQLDVPKSLRTLFSALIQELKPSRVVLVAGSTGGHAAIYQSAFIPDCVAIVSNPIGVIGNYSRAHVSEYQKTCWPNYDSGSFPYMDNAAFAHTKDSSATVIFLNNARDQHFSRQSALLHRVIFKQTGSKNVAVISNFYSAYPGHSFPQTVRVSWIRAAIESVSPSFSDIAERHESTLAKSRAMEVKPSDFSSADIALTDRIISSLSSEAR